MAEQYDENLLLGYVEDDLDATERARVERMAEEDPRLAQLLRHMVEDRRAMRGVRAPAPPEWVMEEVDRRLERSMLLEQEMPEAPASRAEPGHVVGRIGVFASVAALLLLAGGVIVVSLMGLGGERLAFDPEPPAPKTGPVAMDDGVDATETEAEEDLAAGEEERSETAPPAGLARSEARTDAPVDADADSAGAGDGAAVEARVDRLADASAAAERAAEAGDVAASIGNRGQADVDAADAADAPADLARESAKRGADGAMALEGAADRGPEAEAEAGADADAAAPAERLVIRVQTRDVGRSIERLNFATRQIARARLRGGAPEVPETPAVEAVKDGEVSATAEADREKKPTRLEALRATGADDAPRDGVEKEEPRAMDGAVAGEAAPPAPGDDAADEAAEGRGEGEAAEAGAVARARTADRGDGESAERGRRVAVEAEEPAAAGGPGAAVTADNAEAADKAETADEAEPAGEATPAAPARTVRFELEIPADQVEAIVQMLNAAPAGEQPEQDGRYQRALVRREPVGSGLSGREEGIIAETRRNWPSYRPDYGSFVREQLPLADAGRVKEKAEKAESKKGEREDEAALAEGEAAVESGEPAVLGLVVPVVIEHYGELPREVEELEIPTGVEVEAAEGAEMTPEADPAGGDPAEAAEASEEAGASEDGEAAQADADADAEADVDAEVGAEAKEDADAEPGSSGEREGEADAAAAEADTAEAEGEAASDAE